MTRTDDELISFLSENAEWWEQTARFFEETAQNHGGTADAKYQATWNLLSAVQRERAELCRSLVTKLRGNSTRPSAINKETAA
jgi:hypothetical protein